MTRLAFEGERPAVAVHHRGASDAQPLPSPAPHLFGSEEGLEDALANGPWNAAAVVLDIDAREGAFTGRPHPNSAPEVRAPHRVLDGLTGIDQQLEDGLVQLPEVAADERQLAELRLEVGEAPESVRGHDQRRRHRAVQVGRRLLGAVGLGKLLHRPDDGRPS